MSRGGWLCEACKTRFSSLTAFDMHREGEYARYQGTHTRHCLGAAEMRAKGMVANERGAWTTGREIPMAGAA